ncbi:hypothetical protein A4G20_05930 [Pasteurellaceae bacterium RH1A]|nr:hypothetical protein A4G20_05930 [Pasteurellaceae bacterium RH1A]
MKNIKHLSLATLVLALAACGGGGGAGTAQTPDGEKINLELSDKGQIGGKTQEGIFVGQNNNASFYGAWQKDDKSLHELRYQGTKTEILPRGSATYFGDSYWISGWTGNVANGGKTRLDVDFDNKTIEGSIDYTLAEGRRDITLHKTNLSGAEFSGKASVLLNDSGTYKGALFGKNAEEAAGLVEFSNNSSLNTSFGGKR